MKRLSIAIFCAGLAVTTAMAQDIYKVENFAGSDLNGTARYVGMGGAMNALGADISTMSTNPAGIGMMRKSDFSITFGLLSQKNAEKMDDIGKTRMSFDQAGFVFTARSNSKHLRYMNFGFNYKKRRNMKNFIGLYNIGLNNQSQTLQMAELGNYYLVWDDGTNEFISPLAEAAYLTGAIGINNPSLPYDKDTNPIMGYNASMYNFSRVQHGGIHEFDFNFSFNFDDRWYAGITVGAYTVNWHSYTYYQEGWPMEGGGLADYYMANDEQIKGSGFDIKAGFIGRPIEDSPFRFGIAVSTPTWFNLTGNNILDVDAPYLNPSTGKIEGKVKQVPTHDFDYRITTPWKFNFSLATTVGQTLALDAEYEYMDYTGASVRYPESNSNYYRTIGSVGSTYKDRPLASEIDRYMNGVHTFRVGAEARLTKGLYARLGYNYVSKPMKDEAIKNLFIGQDTPEGDSESVINTTGTEYVNLSAINRITAGLGYHGKNFYADLAFQYQAQKGDVYAFHNFDTQKIDEINSSSLSESQKALAVGEVARVNTLQKQTFDLNRLGVQLTLGYKF